MCVCATFIASGLCDPPGLKQPEQKGEEPSEESEEETEEERAVAAQSAEAAGAGESSHLTLVHAPYQTSL